MSIFGPLNIISSGICVQKILEGRFTCLLRKPSHFNKKSILKHNSGIAFLDETRDVKIL